MAAQKQKREMLTLSISECLLTQNPANQDSQGPLRNYFGLKIIKKLALQLDVYSIVACLYPTTL